MGRKKFYRYIKRQSKRLAHKITRILLRTGSLKRESKYRLIKAEINALRKNYDCKKLILSRKAGFVVK